MLTIILSPGLLSASVNVPSSIKILLELLSKQSPGITFPAFSQNPKQPLINTIVEIIAAFMRSFKKNDKPVVKSKIRIIELLNWAKNKWILPASFL